MGLEGNWMGVGGVWLEGNGHPVRGIPDSIKTKLGAELERCLAVGLEGTRWWAGGKWGSKLERLGQ